MQSCPLRLRARLHCKCIDKLTGPAEPLALLRALHVAESKCAVEDGA